MVVRLSADHFVVLLRNVTAESAEAFCAGVQDTLAEPFELIGSKTQATASIGIAMTENEPLDLKEIVRRLEVALQTAKSEAPGSIVFYDQDMDSSVQLRTALSREIVTSLQNDDFFMVYQPLIDTKSIKARGVEALIRWNHPERGRISPGIFIPIAEQMGQIRDISNWVMKQAFEDSRAWNNLTLSINISPLHIRHPEFIADVTRALEATGANPRNIGLEITEGVLLDRSTQTQGILGELRRIGFKIVLDDFGTGYSSLDYLHRHKFDRIKIDKSFIQGLDGVIQAPAIVQAIIRLAHMSGADVVAEGVETADQYEFIKEAGCDLIQGYYFFEPLSAEDVVELTQKKTSQQVA